MKYIALLRGIGPGDPRMRNENLRRVFESLKLSDVQSVISSGNIIFSTSNTNDLEEDIETALYDQLGFHSQTIIRSQGDLKHIIDLQPFGDREHNSKVYLLVTFLKTKPTKLPKLPATSPDGSATLLGFDEQTLALFTATDTTQVKTPDVMLWLEKQFGKQMTSRSWNTIQRIYKKQTI